MRRGLFIGRFQPFHLGHLHLIKTVLEEMDGLIIGIGSSQEQQTMDNPFTVKDRIGMINSTLPNNEIRKYVVYSIPDNPNDIKWVEEVETSLPKFDVVYMSDKNTFGEKWIERCFKDKYVIIKIKALKGIDATIIREKILKKQNWKNLVPKEVAIYINSMKGLKKLKETT